GEGLGTTLRSEAQHQAAATHDQSVFSHPMFSFCVSSFFSCFHSGGCGRAHRRAIRRLSCCSPSALWPPRRPPRCRAVATSRHATQVTFPCLGRSLPLRVFFLTKDSEISCPW